jgi:DNA recombination protein RmuC
LQLDSTALSIIVVGAALAALIFWLIHRVTQSRSTSEKELRQSFQALSAEFVAKQMESMLALRNSIDQANKIVNDRLSEGNRSLDEKVAVFGEIKSKLGELEVQAKNIENIGQNIQSLSELLRPPKLRGQLGETFLENILTQILPRAHFELQHKFPSGQTVDAVIKIGSKLLAVDSKFPLDSFNRHIDNPGNEAHQKEFTKSLKKHVDDISSRYIRPEEETLEIAVMYIPAEAVYYQFVSGEQSVFDYALSKKVVPSSPGHLYAFLAALLSVYLEIGLVTQGRQLSSCVNNIAESVIKLSRTHERMDGSVRNLVSSLGKARLELREIDSNVNRLKEPTEEKEEFADEPWQESL